jgi:hypothetical protein
MAMCKVVLMVTLLSMVCRLVMLVMLVVLIGRVLRRPIRLTKLLGVRKNGQRIGIEEKMGMGMGWRDYE